MLILRKMFPILFGLLVKHLKYNYLLAIQVYDKDQFQVRILKCRMTRMIYIAKSGRNKRLPQE